MTIDHHALLRSASRTFALSIERLPGVVGDAMCLAYLLLRVSDFLEDNDYMPPERKVALLKLWDSILAGDQPAEKLVAGRVGYLVTDIFAWYSGFVRARLNQLMPLAREFGLALQTVNVIRGLRKDYERGWIFVPESFCAAVNLRRSDLFKPEYQIQAL